MVVMKTQEARTMGPEEAEEEEEDTTVVVVVVLVQERQQDIMVEVEAAKVKVEDILTEAADKDNGETEGKQCFITLMTSLFEASPVFKF